MNPVENLKSYTIDDIYALPEGVRADILYGKSDSNTSKYFIGIKPVIADYIDSKNGDCEVYAAPFTVFLNKNRLSIRTRNVSQYIL